MPSSTLSATKPQTPRAAAGVPVSLRLFLLIGIVWSADQTVATLAAPLDAEDLFHPERLVEIEIVLADKDWQTLCKQSRDFGAAFADPTESRWGQASRTRPK